MINQKSTSLNHNSTKNQPSLKLLSSLKIVEICLIWSWFDVERWFVVDHCYICNSFLNQISRLRDGCAVNLYRLGLNFCERDWTWIGWFPLVKMLAYPCLGYAPWHVKQRTDVSRESVLSVMSAFKHFNTVVKYYDTHKLFPLQSGLLALDPM